MSPSPFLSIIHTVITDIMLNFKGSFILEWKRKRRRSRWVHGESNWMFTLSSDENKRIQDSIPVGCVPSATVAVGGGGAAQGVSAHEGCLPRGVYPSMHWARHPPDRIFDTRFWKYYLARTSLRTVKLAILLSPSVKYKWTLNGGSNGHGLMKRYV